MLSITADKFVAAIDALAALGQYLTDDIKKNPAGLDAGKDREFQVLQEIREHVDFLCICLTELELRVSLKAAKKLAALIQSEFVSIEILSDAIRDVHQRMIDELDGRLFLHVSPKNSDLFTVDHLLFGSVVATKFPSAAFEIDESGKCRALARHTASVFHLMRTMEIGIRAASRCLSVPDPTKPAQRNWGHILREMDASIKARKGTWSSPQDAAFFDEVWLSLDRVRSVWRNATMHVESKYTEEEAADIFDAVRSFMRKMASRLDEDGQPLA